jgi:hypothetical protein
MKANELRIGNWFKSVKFEVPVQCELSDLHELCVRSDGAYNDPPIDEMFEPIPLTEEWLLKFGFVKIGEYWYKERFFIEMLFGRLNLRITINNAESAYASSVQYVHQLQNLYFALTGNELEIK